MDADLIVVRFADGTPTVPDLDGVWFDRSRFPLWSPDFVPGPGRMVARPTGQFETRDDGVVAEVWLISLT